jgi:hypothetical protein
MGGRPQVTDASIGGQGSDVQQNSGGSVKRHGLIIGGRGGLPTSVLKWSADRGVRLEYFVGS